MPSLAHLAELVGGTVQGDAKLNVQRVMPMDAAQEGDITFLANPKYRSKLPDCKASAVIVSPGIESPGHSLLVCANPYLAFAQIMTEIAVPKATVQGILPGAIVDGSADVAEGCTVYPGAVIGADVRLGPGTIVHSGAVIGAGVSIGADCLIHANATIREGCVLGDRVILQPAAVIGSDGFGYAPDGQKYYKIPQVGIVELGDDVEIGACSCIDRAAMGVTRIGRGTKIDNLVQVGHNAVIGEDTIIVAQVAIAGSSTIGNHCTFGGQSAISGHITIGDNLMLGAKSGIANHTEGNQVLSGAPAIPHRQWLKASTLFGRLPEMNKEIKELKKQVESLLAIKES